MKEETVITMFQNDGKFRLTNLHKETKEETMITMFQNDGKFIVDDIPI